MLNYLIENRTKSKVPPSFWALPGRFAHYLGIKNETENCFLDFFSASLLFSEAVTSSHGTNKANADTSRFYVIKKKDLAVIQDIHPFHQ